MGLLDDLQSVPVAALSGSAGAIVAAHNQYGPYFRARTIPIDRLTFAQANWRNALRLASSEWKRMSAAQRASWQAYAIAIARTRPKLRPSQLSGRNEFLRAAVPRRGVGLATIRTAPTVLAEPVFHLTHVETAFTPPRIRTYFDTSDDWVTQLQGGLIVAASPRLSYTINFHVSPMRVQGMVRGDPVSPPASPADTLYNFGTGSLTVPIRVHYRLSLDDGRLSRRYWAWALPAT